MYICELENAQYRDIELTETVYASLIYNLDMDMRITNVESNLQTVKNNVEAVKNNVVAVKDDETNVESNLQTVKNTIIS